MTLKRSFTHHFGHEGFTLPALLRVGVDEAAVRTVVTGSLTAPTRQRRGRLSQRLSVV